MFYFYYLMLLDNEQSYENNVNVHELITKIRTLENTNKSLLNEIHALKEELTFQQQKTLKHEALIDKVNTLKNENETLKSRMLTLQKEYESFKLTISNQFDKEVNLVRTQNENNLYKIDNVNKLEKFNATLFNKILELENTIKHFSKEEQSKINKVQIEYQNKLDEFKLKMINFMRKEYLKNTNTPSKVELNKNLTLLHINQLLDELSFQSKHIEELIKEKDILNRKINELKLELEIHLKVETLLGEKNKLFQSKLITKSKNIKTKQPLTDRNIQHTKPLSTNSNYKQVLLTKELIMKNKEKEQYKLKYQTERDKMDAIKRKYFTLFEMVDSALNKTYSTLNNNIHINKEQFTNCEFQTLSHEQKQHLLSMFLNNIFDFLKDELVDYEHPLLTNRTNIHSDNINGNNSISRLTNNTTSSNFYKSSYTSGKGQTGDMLLSTCDLMRYRKDKVNQMKENYKKNKLLYSPQHHTASSGTISKGYYERTNSWKHINEIGYNIKRSNIAIKNTQLRVSNLSVFNGFNF